jgi:hypothetical protein
VHWADGGRTDEANMLLLCPRHHHAAHEGRWALTFEGRHARWTDPHGRPYRTPPPLAEPPSPDDLLPFFARSWFARPRPAPLPPDSVAAAAPPCSDEAPF